MKAVTKMKLLISDPVPSAPGVDRSTLWSWYEHLEATAARPGTTLEFTTLREGYSNLHTAYTESYNAIQMAKRAYEAEKKGYDAFIIGCCFDPGLRQARALVDIPVVGPMQSVASLAATLGHKFSIITFGQTWNVSAIEELIQRYGLAGRLASVRNLSGLAWDEAFRQMYGGKENERKFVKLVTAEMSKAVHEDGAEVLWIACTCGGSLLTVHGVHEVDGAIILDPLVAAIKMAETSVDLKRAYGITVSRLSDYSPAPPGWEKEIPIPVK